MATTSPTTTAEGGVEYDLILPESRTPIPMEREELRAWLMRWFEGSYDTSIRITRRRA